MFCFMIKCGFLNLISFWYSFDWLINSFSYSRLSGLFRLVMTSLDNWGSTTVYFRFLIKSDLGKFKVSMKSSPAMQTPNCLHCTVKLFLGALISVPPHMIHQQLKSTKSTATARYFINSWSNATCLRRT